jgi:hypothetical protein
VFPEPIPSGEPIGINELKFDDVIENPLNPVAP